MSRHIYVPRSECVPQINLLCGCYSVGRLGYGSALLLNVFDIRKACGSGSLSSPYSLLPFCFLPCEDIALGPSSDTGPAAQSGFSVSQTEGESIATL